MNKIWKSNVELEAMTGPWWTKEVCPATKKAEYPGCPWWLKEWARGSPFSIATPMDKHVALEIANNALSTHSKSFLVYEVRDIGNGIEWCMNGDSDIDLLK